MVWIFFKRGNLCLADRGRLMVQIDVLGGNEANLRRRAQSCLLGLGTFFGGMIV